VEEAAQRLGISEATVKRRLQKRQLVGRKIGRQWVVDDAKLPAPVRSIATGSGSGGRLDMVAAFRYVRSTDLNELWVPDVLRWADHIANSQPILMEATARATTGRCDAATELDVPKTPMLTRPAVMLSLEDRLAYQAVVGALLPLIESELSPRVYSSRASNSPAHFFQKSTEQWLKWHRRIHQEVKSGASWVAQTDLTAYFESVDHAILLSELTTAGASSQVVGVLRKFLDTWSRTRGRGLPQGPNASRALGNFYMAAIDQLMLKNGINYWRYMDDVMIVAPTKAEAMAGMRIFEAACRRRGLIISGHKTKMLTGDDALQAGSKPDRDAAQYLINSRQDRKAKKALRRILRHSLSADGNVDVGASTFSLWRLAQMVDKTPLRVVLSRLEDLGPVARVGAAYLRLFLWRPDVAAALSSFLGDPTRNTSPVTESWLFACMVEHPGALPTSWIDRARAVAQDRNGLNFHRALAVGVLALGKVPADLSWIRGELRREYDPEILRGYVVALARVGELDKTTGAIVQARAPFLASTVSYLSNRGTLPSLVWRGQTVKVK
jgi:hypothetical protein